MCHGSPSAATCLGLEQVRVGELDNVTGAYLARKRKVSNTVSLDPNLWARILKLKVVTEIRDRGIHSYHVERREEMSTASTAWPNQVLHLPCVETTPTEKKRARRNLSDTAVSSRRRTN